MDDPRKEAEILIEQVKEDLLSRKPDIKIALRKSMLACHLLNWNDKHQWFTHELEGYPSEIQRPNYRTAYGTSSWKPRGTISNRVFWDTSKEMHKDEYKQETVTLDVYANIDWVISAAQTGYIETTDEEQSALFRDGRMSVTLQKENHYLASTFRSILTHLENEIYKFASSAYVELRYGELQTDIWNEYMSVVEKALSAMNLANHLAAIQQGFEMENPEALRNSILGCRNLLKDVASFLWKDDRSTYDLLPGDGDNQKLQVTPDKFKNRLSAYLHQKTISLKNRKYLETEMMYLTQKISSLITLQAKGKDDISLDNAKSIAISTYFLIGELAIRTDLQPITSYVEHC